jgi:hypothetical protein
MADSNIVGKRVLTQRFESGRMSPELLAMAFGALKLKCTKSAVVDQADPRQTPDHNFQSLQEVGR